MRPEQAEVTPLLVSLCYGTGAFKLTLPIKIDVMVDKLISFAYINKLSESIIISVNFAVYYLINFVLLKENRNECFVI